MTVSIGPRIKQDWRVLGPPAFATVKGDPTHYTATLEALIGERGITPEYTDRIAPAKGMSSGGRIEVLPGLPAAEQFSVGT